jgi:hypothetical protein
MLNATYRSECVIRMGGKGGESEYVDWKFLLGTHVIELELGLEVKGGPCMRW